VSCNACLPAFLQVFSEADFETFMHSDDEILRSAHARWMLLSERAPTCETVDATSTIEAKGVYIEQSPLAIGSAAAPATSVVSGAGSGNGLAAVDASLVPDLEVSGPNVTAEHARVWKDAQGDCWVQDLPSSSGTWVNGKLVKKGDKIRLMPQVSMAVLTWLLCWQGCGQHGVLLAVAPKLSMPVRCAVVPEWCMPRCATMQRLRQCALAARLRKKYTHAPGQVNPRIHTTILSTHMHT
jgi:hypothetical protein